MAGGEGKRGGPLLAVVREWRTEEGWGVIDSPDTPGGCWAHFSDVDVPGYRVLHAGQSVHLWWEAPGFDQDGYPYRACRVVPLATARTIVEGG